MRLICTDVVPTSGVHLELSLVPDPLSPAVAIFLLACSILTSMVTASLGAGGGVLLLVLMAMWVPSAAIIPVHGMIQLGSNVGRAALTWRHTDWRAIAAFAPGVVVGATLGALLLVELPLHVLRLTIAVFVLYLCWGPSLPRTVFGPLGIFVASTLTSFISLFVGASGPLVAAFLKQMHVERFTTVATFATAMTLQHAPKAWVFGAAGFVFAEWLPFSVGMIGCGFAGNWIGLHVLRSISNRHFRRAFDVVLSLLALRLLAQAAAEAGWW